MQLDTVYLAPEGFVEQLVEELLRAGQKIVFRHERLIGAVGYLYHAVWAENIWFTPLIIPISSINDAVQRLKKIQRNWALYPICEFGRAKLIQEGLPKVSAKPLIFGSPPPSSPLGSWTLWDKNTLLASAHCKSPFVHGVAVFAEDKKGPPNRAYLKLWEGFTRMGVAPGPGDLCVELGSAPGGWTWVLSGLGAHVFSIDKAPLCPSVARHPLVEHCIGSAFALEPEVAGAVTWLFSDVACYPERLLDTVTRWIESGQCERFFCTIKFSGATDFGVLDRFLAIPGSSAMHLSVNKHEVTWFRLPTV